MTPQYLGDGVYLKETTQGICLYTSDGIKEENQIYLDFSVILSLIQYLFKRYTHLKKLLG